ncbi:hypothetical protein [Pelomonas sp. Root1217]|uniref:hypothetical protein n=1 Tax=Pelomonas sp. Root1217 TaxID=1736430 RepID=UPI000B0BD07F|nr:hypothetical protein [Pelomonas sp. Root1217]
MTSLRASAAALILCAALPALAQTAPAKPVAKHKAAAKPAPAKKAPPPPPEPVLVDADEAQLAAAERAYLGDYACEFKETVQIEKHPKVAGYINVAWKKQVFTMKPVLSSTGALRLEDVMGRTLMIQIANKSMLLDTKIGQRLIDDCVHPEQIRLMEAAKAAKINDPEAEAAEAARSGLGITPTAAETSAAAPVAAKPAKTAKAR